MYTHPVIKRLKGEHLKRFLRILFVVLIFFSHLYIVANSYDSNSKSKLNDPTKIACVGTSITFGSFMDNRAENAYPVQLQRMLGNSFRIKNFGSSGATLLSKGDLPYVETQEYKDALAFHADVIFIELGINDSKLQNRRHLKEFEQNYTALINSFKQENEEARIILLLPLPSFATDSSQIWNPVIKERIIPLVQNVANSTESEIIDLYQLFVNQNGLLPDNIHPSSLGATVIARRAYEVVVQDHDDNYDISRRMDFQNTRIGNFYGYKMIDFVYNGVNCKIVQPKIPNKKHDWVWRARFWGHEPQTDIALLERGFHIVYCDVSNLYGNNEAVTRWDEYYDLMTEYGLAEKAVLEGMSRGGLIIYNWAAKNETKVAAVYADAPVLDGTSWPGGIGIGKGSDVDWDEFKIRYNLESEETIENFKDNPIHKTKIIAQAGFPMLHVCGEADSVVPVSENTRIFENKIKLEGGDIKVIYKENIGHHPHSLENPTPIVNFILNATKLRTNFATIPSPGSEYRSGAGWPEGKGWWYQKNDIDSLCRVSENIDALFIGNSITQGWGGSRKYITYAPGGRASKKKFNDLNWINAGISGDRTEHILYRILHGDYRKCKPKTIILTIGVNNFPFNSAKEISKGIELNINILKETFPESNIILIGPLPTGINKNTDRRKKYETIHELIKHLDEMESVYYCNLIDLFIDKNENLDLDLYSKDGIHLKPAGYIVWGDYIKNKISKFGNDEN